MNYLKVVEECKQLTLLATFAPFEKLYEEMKKTGGIIFNNSIGISGSNLQKFDKIVDSIWLNKDESVYYLARNTIKQYCLDVIQEIHANGEDSAKNNAELNTRWEELIQKEMTNYYVVFPLYGVTIDKVTPISLFTAYNADDYKIWIGNEFPTEKNLREPLFEDDANYLVLQIEAKESGRATELARPFFELFEYISKFWINDSRRFDVGTFNYKKWQIGKGLAFSKEEISVSFDQKGAYENINISELINFPTKMRLWEILTKYLQRRTTEMETRLINSIKWVGMANSDDSNVTKHVKCVFAIETLLSQSPKNEIIKSGIAHKLAEYAAFIIGEIPNAEISKQEFRKKIFHEVKHIYSTRSGIVHGNDKNSNVHEIARARKLIYSLIYAILQNETILKFTSTKELDDWIENLRFS